MKLSHWLIFMCLMCITVSTSAQKRNKVYEDYIHKYRGIAVDEMKHYRIPASITLAQGLLESGAGKVSWRGNRTITLVSSVAVHGTDVPYVMTMMRVMSVFVLTSIRRILIATIQNFYVRVRAMRFCFV